MPIPRIAIVGRPNVGKSSLLNLIAQERVAIVDPTPGVTRDRISTIAQIDHPTHEGPKKPVEVMDTGGFGVYVAEGGRYNEIGEDLSSLTKDIEFQIAEAVSNADIIIFAVDCQAGITSQDQAIAQMLREQKLGRTVDEQKSGTLKPVYLMATKCDSSKWEPHAYELSALGFGVPLICSATSKYMRRDMLDKLYEIVPINEDPPEPECDMKIAIVGKRNAGKSTLINQLAGEDRVIVSEIAGTTRDAVDVKIEMDDGKSVVAIDTAGLRRKKSFQDQIEWYALDRAQRAIKRCDVVLYMLDATTRISQVDEQLAKLIVDSFKPVVIVVNKWDEAKDASDEKGRKVSPQRYEDYIRKELKGLKFAPIAIMSAKTGLNVTQTIELAFEMLEQTRTRLSTGQLNRAIKSILSARGPSNKLGLEAKVYFASQVKTEPPTLVLVVNNPDLFTHNYERFLMNRLREVMPFSEVPIRLILRARARVEKRIQGKSGRVDLHTPDPVTGKFDTELEIENIDRDALLVDMPDDAALYFDD